MARGTIGTADAVGIHDTLVTFGDDSIALYSMHNVPGTYRVVLHHAGYHDWNSDDIQVVWGRCGGGNVTVPARLQPIPP